MKILHIIGHFATGGIQTLLINIVNYQCKSNDVSLLILGNRVKDDLIAMIDPRVNIYCCHLISARKNPLPLFKMNYYIYKMQPDIIHQHSENMSRYLLGSRKMLYTVHSTNLKFECRKYLKCFSISESVHQEILGYGYDAKVVENGIDCKRFLHKKQQGFFDNDLLHFIQVSRLLCSHKGQDIVLKAMSILKCKYNSLPFVMHFVGEGVDEAFLRKMASEYGINDKVVFEGYKASAWVERNLCNFDLYIQASRYEGFGLTVAEAMASKVPVLVSENEGPLEIISNGKYGYIFKNGSPESLASAIAEFLDNTHPSLIEDAYAHVCDQYDVRATAQKYLDEYAIVLKQDN